MSIKVTEDVILSQIISHAYYREKVVPFLKSEYFTDDDHERLFRVIDKLLIDGVKIFDKTVLTLNYGNIEVLDSILSLEFNSANIEWLLTDTEKWAKDRALEVAIMKSADAIEASRDSSKEGDSDAAAQKIYSLITNALTVSFDNDLGLDYLNDVELRFDRYNKVEKKGYRTGYSMLDFYTNGGLKGKTLTVILGSSGIGKTNTLCNLACNLSAVGMNGIYFTLELDKDVIGRRCDAINTQIPYFQLIQNKRQVVEYFSKYRGGNIFVKEYPPSKATTNNLRTYLKELEIHKNYKPDYIAVDYLNLMKPNLKVNAENMYQYFFQVSLDLRELAIELDIPIITASQVGKQAYGTANVGLEDVRGSMGIVENADLIIALSQIPDQEPENLITWKIIKNRLGRRNGKLESQINSETLRMSEIITSEDRALLDGKESFRTNHEEITELNSLLKETENIGFDEFS